MLYHFLEYTSEAIADKLHFYAYRYVMFRSMLATLTSLLIALFIFGWLCPWTLHHQLEIVS